MSAMAPLLVALFCLSLGAVAMPSVDDEVAMFQGRVQAGPWITPEEKLQYESWLDKEIEAFKSQNVVKRNIELYRMKHVLVPQIQAVDDMLVENEYAITHMDYNWMGPIVKNWTKGGDKTLQDVFKASLVVNQMTGLFHNAALNLGTITAYANAEPNARAKIAWDTLDIMEHSVLSAAHDTAVNIEMWGTMAEKWGDMMIQLSPDDMENTKTHVKEITEAGTKLYTDINRIMLGGQMLPFLEAYNAIPAVEDHHAGDVKRQKLNKVRDTMLTATNVMEGFQHPFLSILRVETPWLADEVQAGSKPFKHPAKAMVKFVKDQEPLKKFAESEAGKKARRGLRDQIINGIIEVFDD